MLRQSMLLLALLPFVSEAQVPVLMPGARVRISAPGYGPSMTGTVMSQSADTIQLAESGATMRHIPTATVREIRASTGKSHRAGAIKGAKIGGVIGAVGGALSLGVLAPYSHVTGENAVRWLLLWTTVGAGYGVGGGAVVKAEHWQRVYSSRARIAVLPYQRGAAVSLSARF